MAKKKLATHKYDETTVAYKCYKDGKLSPAHMVRLAAFKTVCLFVGVVHDYWSQQLGRVIDPYPFAILGHDKLAMVTMDEVLKYEEERSAQNKANGKSPVPTYEEYLAWSEVFNEDSPRHEDTGYEHEFMRDLLSE